MAERQYPTSRLPEGGINKFQEIKAVTSEAAERGIEIIKLSIGEPEGPALESARIVAARAIMSDKPSMHVYQDNGSDGADEFIRDNFLRLASEFGSDRFTEREKARFEFAARFVQGHLKTSLDDVEINIDFLPIPGIKPMLGLIPLSCGGADRKLTIVTMTNPGYPTPKDWVSGYLHHDIIEPPLNPENSFRWSLEDIPYLSDIVMINYPHNPSGQVATREWLEQLCKYCAENNIRLFNDAAYIALSHTDESSSLADVAVRYPDLSWVEAYSASKLIGNGTGWRVGAMVGSPDFIGDIKKIKGNTDSGFVPAMAVGALFALEYDRENIEKVRLKYEKRLTVLNQALIQNGMQLAIEPKAAFFSLGISPKYAFEETMSDAKHFNFSMIGETGLVAVHFDPYIRYAVCAEDVEGKIDRIDGAFKKAAVSY